MQSKQRSCMCKFLYLYIIGEECRKAHRKCDRNQPSCSRCKQRRIKCVYKPRKKSKKAQVNEPEEELLFNDTMHTANQTQSKETQNSKTSSTDESGLKWEQFQFEKQESKVERPKRTFYSRESTINYTFDDFFNVYCGL